MNKQWKKNRQWYFSSIVSFLIIVSMAVPALSQEQFICVWRNPERTMTQLFPEARDYRTQTVNITAKQLTAIETRIEMPVLDGQREQFQYYEMLDGDGSIVGYTSAVTQKGEFGAIEFVFGLNTNYEVIGIYIQRARERNREFKEPSFLETFVGTSVSTAEEIIDPLGENGNVGTTAIVNGLRKELVTFDVLVLQ